MPFLENVLRGRNVPRERMLEVADHYYQFGGNSPINEQNRALIAALEKELAAHGPNLPIYWGNRNWHPLLADTLRQMAADGIHRALAFVTSAYSSYSGCRQYRENIARAQEEVGPDRAAVDKLRVFFNHPGFIEPMIERTELRSHKSRRSPRRGVVNFHRPQHSAGDGRRLPIRSATSRSMPTGRDGVGRSDWHLVYQSRSGPPQQPWLEPDIGDFLREQHAIPSVQDVVIVPIGFISDHLEVLYDLDTEARELCDELGINMVRAATVGTHPRFIRMIRELIVERMTESADRPALGTLGPNHDVCPDDCCLLKPLIS